MTSDYSSIRDWIGNLSTTEISENSLKFIWNEGRNSAKDILKANGYSQSELLIDDTNVDTLAPLGNKSDCGEIDENIEEFNLIVDEQCANEEFELNDNLVDDIQTNISLESVK